jgi:hypothetical protein
MRDGIYIRPAVVRLMVLTAVAAAGYVLKHEIPTVKRYVKFETM